MTLITKQGPYEHVCNPARTRRLLLVSAEGSLQDGFPYMNMYCKLHNKVVVPSKRHIVYKEKVVHTYKRYFSAEVE